MKSPTVSFHFSFRFLLFLLVPIQSFGLNPDGIALLSFKYSVFSDPLLVLQTWNYWDQTPCSWTGVTCSPPGLLDTYARVTGLSLPNSRLTGSLFSDFSMVQHLRNLDLSNNSFNGSLPFSLFNVSDLRLLDLSNNLISGVLPENIAELRNLQVLNLSENAFTGKVPYNITVMQNLSVVSLNNNYFSGSLPSGFNYVQVLDLSSNLINGSLPLDFGGKSLRFFNISYNKLSGEIPPEFAGSIPENATIDFSFNNFTGEIPEKTLFSNQESKSFSGNNDLCGKILNNPCTIPSSLSDPPPNSTTPTDSPPAIAAIPQPTVNSSNSQHTGKLRPVTIVAIVIGDLIGIILFVVVFIYVCQLRKRNKNNNVTTKKTATIEASVAKDDWSTSSSSETKGITAWSCLRQKTSNADEDSSDSTDSDSQGNQTEKTSQHNQRSQASQQNKGGSLVTVDGGEKELELETLLKASAYILGATGSSIMYKAVLQDGTVLAVRRIGESGLDRFRDFENQVRVIAKLVHPNLVRIRGFYWGVDEKLVIYDFVPNGSLANARYRKIGSSPTHLPWESRLKIAKGVAKGLAYLHEKKHVHGNLKPSNILLGSDMEPKIGDFGLERLVNNGESSYTTGGSSRNFGSKRSTASRESFQDIPNGPSPNPSPSPSSLSCASYYHAPESLRTLKPNAKWDVYAFGVLLLELLTGKAIDLDELAYGPGPGLLIEDKNRAMKMTDVAIRGDVEGKEDALLACFKLGISCVSLVPQKRPMMKEVVHVLEKLPSSVPSQFYGH